MPRVSVLFYWLITIGSKFHFSEVKVDESYRWRHQSKLQKTPSETAKSHSRKNEWIFHIWDFWFVNIRWIPRGTLSPFLQNLIGRSGNSPWIKIGEKSFTRDSEAKKFCFLVLSITYWYISGVISRFFHFRVTWLYYSVRKKSSYRFWNHFCWKHHKI